MNKQMNQNKGFSLIELLIAIAILAIIMVMISGFVSSTVAADRRTKRDMQMQEEAQRIYSQLSDAIMQATYIRVQAADDKVYEYDAAKNECTDVSSSVSLGTKHFVPDDYCNYQIQYKGQEYPRKVIVNFDDFTLVNEKDKTYPVAGAASIDNDTELVKSFRALKQTDSTTNLTTEYFIQPKYIYIEYSNSSTEIKYEADDDTKPVESTKSKVACMVLEYDKDARKIYVYRHEKADDVPTIFNFSKVDSTMNDTTKVDKKNSYLSDSVKEFYLSADSDANSMDIVLNFENKKNPGYFYRLKEIVKIRNSNVLTVKPQLLLKKKGTGN